MAPVGITKGLKIRADTKTAVARAIHPHLNPRPFPDSARPARNNR